MPTIGIEPAEIPASRPPSPEPRPLKLVYVGKVILLKGIDLALEALSRADRDTTLTVVGQGPFLKRAVRMAKASSATRMTAGGCSRSRSV